MKKFTEATLWIDAFIVLMFMKLTHWIDYRWHINQFRVAKAVMSFAIAQLVATTIQLVAYGKRDWMVDPILVLTLPPVVGIYFYYLKRMDGASRSYEQRPDYISRDAAFFLGMPGYLRLMLLFCGIMEVWSKLQLLRLNHATLITVVMSPWILLIAVSWYIAGGLPPKRDRKKKKARAPFFGQLAPTTR